MPDVMTVILSHVTVMRREKFESIESDMSQVEFGEMGGHGELWRLQAPGRDKTGIDQHQRRAFWPFGQTISS